MGNFVQATEQDVDKMQRMEIQISVHFLYKNTLRLDL
jgi:hypothetical protein